MTYLSYLDNTGAEPKPQIFKLLIEAGIDVNWTNGYKTTAVSFLTKHLYSEETPKVLEMLIESGFNFELISIASVYLQSGL